MAIDVSLILLVIGADLVLSLKALANTQNLATRNARYIYIKKKYYRIDLLFIG